MKSQFGQDWALNAAYFRARTSDEIPVLANTGGRSVFQNVGSTGRDGVEAVLSGRWQGGWSLREFLRVDNIGDRNDVGSVIVNEGNSRFFEPAPGRTWLGLSAACQFQGTERWKTSM